MSTQPMPVPDTDSALASGPANPAPAPAPPDISTPAPSPDLMTGLSSMDQPGNQPTAMGSEEGQGYQSAVAAQQAAAKKAADLANQPVAPASTPHSRLLNIISAIGVGLSAAGDSIATKGQRGGAAEVAQVEGAQQEQKLQAQQAAMSQRNQQIQQQLTVAGTNQTLAQSYLNLMSVPDEIEAHHLQVQQGQQALATGQQNAQIQLADFMKQNWGFSPNEMTGAQTGQTPTAADPAHIQTAQSMLTRTVGDPSDPKTTGAVAILGADNPAVKTALAVAKDPNATVQSILAAGQGLNVALQQNAQVQEARTKKEAAEAGSPVAKLGTPEALAAPGAQAAIQAKIDDPTTDPNDIPRLRALLPQAAVAQFNAENIKQREARNTQILSQGDPDQAGKLLANRSLTLDELKSRQVTPEFITAAIQAAQKYDPNFKAAESAAQAAVAKSANNQQFFGNTDSLLVKGGTLDQLQARAHDLPNGKIPIFNKVTNLVSQATGQGPTAAYAASVLGVADDYAKVMGVGSDTAREQVMERLNRAQSPEQADAVINQFRQQVKSQRDGRLGSNPYLRDIYPDPTATRAVSSPAGSAASKLHANLSDFAHQYSGKKGTIYSDDGKTWYDANGSLVK